MNIYLDIDGVLLADMGMPANYADEFIQAVISKYPDSTYWPTTHVWQGENTVSRSLSPYLRSDTQVLLDKIKPTVWDEYKTDAIDFTQPFLWFDDDLYDEEQRVLAENNALDGFRRIDLGANPNQLADEIESLNHLKI